MSDALRSKFWTLSLDELNEKEWEALCDGCAKCCLVKFQDEDTDEILFTKVACKLLDTKTCQCKDYKNRLSKVSQCFKLKPENIHDILDWLPQTCAYKLRYHNEPLPNWHYLIKGTKSKMHQKKQSVKFFAIQDKNLTVEYIETNLNHYLIYLN